MIRIAPNVISFSSEAVAEMLRDALLREGIEAEPIAVQIGVQLPFQDGATHHSEVPSLTVILSSATAEPEPPRPLVGKYEVRR